jgi:hypothetical protein
VKHANLKPTLRKPSSPKINLTIGGERFGGRRIGVVYDFARISRGRFAITI